MSGYITQKPTLPIWSTLTAAVPLVKGTKRATWLVVAASVAFTIVYGVVIGILAMLLMPILKAAPMGLAFILLVLVVAGFVFVQAPWVTGILMIGIQRARGAVIKVPDGLHYFHKNTIVPLGLSMVMYSAAYFLITAAFIFIAMFIAGALIGFMDPTFLLDMQQEGHPLISNIFGILASPHPIELLIMALVLTMLVTFVMEFFIFSLPLVVDKKLTPLTAIRKAFHYAGIHWWRLFFLMFLLQIFNKIALLPYELGVFYENIWMTIGGGIITALLLIWLLPYIVVVLGITYHRMVDL